MKREIKFRVWTGQEMEYRIMAGSLGAFYVQGIDEKDAACMSSFNTKYPDNCPLMQFTGLKDVNGKEIYEGDILKLLNNDMVKVQWSNISMASFVFESQIDKGFLYERMTDLCHTIIGNIYENPELIISKK